MKIFLFSLSLLYFIGFSFSLKISEVYFDSTDEFIGIFNETNKLFSGNIIISGAKKSNISLFIEIGPKNEIVIGDDLKFLSGINLYKSGLGLSFSDSKAINIDLLTENNKLLDTFFVSTGEVTNLDKKKNTSFEKIYSGGNWFVQDVKTGINIQDGYLANPGYVFYNSGSQNNQEEQQDNNLGNGIIVQTCFISLKNISGNNYNFIYTGNFNLSGINWYINNSFFTSGQNMSIKLSSGDNLIQGVGTDLSGNICTGSYFLSFINENNNFYNGVLKINEIHPRKDNMEEFVELKAFGNISGDYIFSGFLSSTKTFSLHLNMYSGLILVLSDSYSGFLYTGNIILKNLSLKDNGENLQILKDGEIIDDVIYNLRPALNQSLYYSSTSGDKRYFNKLADYTPGYENYILNLMPALETTSCKIILQSKEEKDNQLKVNFDTDIFDYKYCSSDYRQIWTYTGHILTGTCNPSYFYFDTGENIVNFKIENLSGETVCEDNFNILYLQKQQEKLENLNCYIKIQSKTDSFLSKDKINFITIVNDKEIQNSNINYSCIYSLSGNILSNECNPGSLYLSGGLNIIDLEIMSNDGLSCQTKLYLNLLEENTITKTKILNNKPSSSFCSKMNSSDLKILVSLIKNKYKSLTTIKKIFDPIKDLYVKEDDIKQYLKWNSKKLKELVDNIDKKYKSEKTKKKIFSSISYLFKENLIKTGDIFTGFNLKILKILPNPVGKDTNKEVIVLTGNYKTGVYIKTLKKSYLNLSGSNLYFTGTFNMKNSFGCVGLLYSGNLLDKKCYGFVKEGQFIDKFDSSLKYKKLDNITFSGDNIILSNGQIIKNISLIKYKKDIKKRIKKVIKIIKNIIKDYKKQIKKLKKENEKIRKVNLKRTVKYVLLLSKLKKIKTDYLIKSKNKYKKLKEKILTVKNIKKEIKQKNNIICFMKSFIRKIKKYIDKDIYKDYLDKLNLVEKGKKIRY